MFNRVQNKSLYSRPFLTDVGFGIPLEKEAVVRRRSLKKLAQLFSCEFCKTFQNTCFYWTLPVATFVDKKMKYDEITKENVMIYDL